MKIIALEEHFRNAAIDEAMRKHIPLDQKDIFDKALASFTSQISQARDLGAERLRQMDATGIDMQVLSYGSPGTQILPASEAVPLARDANDQLAAAIAAHPERFAGFATLPTPDPEAAASELERAVQKLGFKGAMINGRTGDRFLDDPSFRPLLEAAVALDVPLYLHPTIPSRAVQDAYYSHLDPAISGVLATAGWGWHMETGTHALRMIVAGVFDQYPRLQLILGHWGEMIPFYLARVDGMMTPVTKHLQRRVSDYFLQQIYVTPSGMFTLPPFLLTLQIMGADRIMYAVDYPYIAGEQARTFLETAPISPADKEKIAHGNAEKLLKISPR
ncbi:MAG TPA: amidohydrolase family protein [Ktedonobacteraceae bacterium]|jgi:predicted TIM-barrel fold metal-dependent hydrolase|nr:amidohydrolase family protein [Ktedonobacteraceae bacterium]